MRFASEAVRATESIFLGNSCYRKRLAGETRQQDVVIRDVRCVHLRNVPVDMVTAGIIVGIGFLRVTVPFASEHALTAQALEGHADATNAGKKIDEGEWGIIC